MCVDFVLDYTPSIISPVQKDKNYNHKILSSADMGEKSKLFGEMVRSAAHVHLLCSVMASRAWYRVLSRETEAQEATGKSSTDSFGAE